MSKLPKWLLWFQRIPLVLRYGLAMGLGLILLKTLEYQMFSYRFSMDLYIGLLALFFALLGLAVGLGWFQKATTSNGVSATLPDVPVLTHKELQLLSGLAQGKTNQQLADAQHVSVNTVKTHLKSLYKKLEVSKRSEAVQRGKHLGLLAE